MKKFILLLLCAAICVSMIACGASSEPDATQANDVKPEINVVIDEVPLTDEENEILGLIANDVATISDEEYISVVSEMIHHTANYTGKVYQIEGILTVEGENATVSRTLVHGSETLTLGLPLRYLTKEIENGAWVRVTAIVAENNGATVLDVVAVEGLAEAGNAALEWDGNDTHQH